MKTEKARESSLAALRGADCERTAVFSTRSQPVTHMRFITNTADTSISSLSTLPK